MVMMMMMMMMMLTKITLTSERFESHRRSGCCYLERRRKRETSCSSSRPGNFTLSSRANLEVDVLSCFLASLPADSSPAGSSSGRFSGLRFLPALSSYLVLDLLFLSPYLFLDSHLCAPHPRPASSPPPKHYLNFFPYPRRNLPGRRETERTREERRG